MAATQTIFNRYEKKYLLTRDVYCMLRARLRPFMQEDAYGLYTICNLYYDTDDRMLIRRSLEKPPYKEKLRIRSYGVPKENGKVFLEIKKKYRRVVNKRRIALPLNEAMAFAEQGKLPSHIFYDEDAVRKDPAKVRFETAQIVKEIECFVKRYPLARGTFLAYDRMALTGTMDGFRVTFDRNIRSRNRLINPANGDFGTPLLPDGTYLMETKIYGVTPKWFSDILDEMRIYPTSFSKYGNVYRQEEAGFDYMDLMTHRLENWRAGTDRKSAGTAIALPDIASGQPGMSPVLPMPQPLPEAI